jgi:hypothetical protein
MGSLRFDVLACPEDRTTPESLFLPEASEDHDPTKAADLPST